MGESLSPENGSRLDILEQLETALYRACAIDLHQNIIFSNARAERILGYGPKQVLGRKCHGVLHGLALDCATPFCARDCPAMAAARAGNITAAKQARMQRSSEARKRVSVIPLIAGYARGRTLLVRMYHEPPGDGPSPTQDDALPLTPRERQILVMLAQGMRPADIGGGL